MVDIWITDIFDPICFEEEAEVWDDDGKQWEVELINEKPDEKHWLNEK